MRRSHADQPVLITTAPTSNAHEYDARRRKYAIMMSLRALCVIGAAATYHVSIVLSMLCVVGGVVLPWCAVLIANDGPARKRAPAPPARPSVPVERALPAGVEHRVVDL